MAVSKFRVGDRVYAPFRGYGTITQILEDKCVYPIIVEWDASHLRFVEDSSTFTEDGYLSEHSKTDDLQITIVKKKEKQMAEAKFKIGDSVYAPHFGEGIVTGIDESKNSIYPIHVKWTKTVPPYHSLGDCFTPDGRYTVSAADQNFDIFLLDALNKKTDDAINPAHYRVKGIPEAYDIMTHLMNREQLEGFFWGNIIKYAYRYGRKGDKAETAGKIKWYAQKLKELGECESK
jgi:hypothetical protein